MHANLAREKVRDGRLGLVTCMNRDRELVPTFSPVSHNYQLCSRGLLPWQSPLLPIAPTFEAMFPVVRYALHCIILIIQYSS
jgi:hypothetical protein